MDLKNKKMSLFSTELPHAVLEPVDDEDAVDDDGDNNNDSHGDQDSDSNEKWSK